MTNLNGSIINLSFSVTNANDITTIRLDGKNIYNGPSNAIPAPFPVGIDTAISGQTLDVISSLNMAAPGASMSGLLTLSGGSGTGQWREVSNDTSDHYIAHIYIV